MLVLRSSSLIIHKNEVFLFLFVRVAEGLADVVVLASPGALGVAEWQVEEEEGARSSQLHHIENEAKKNKEVNKQN